MKSTTVGGEATISPPQTLGTSFIKPNKPLGTKSYHLTSFDLQYLFISHIQRLLIYKSSDKLDEIEKKLKLGLSVALEEFYPLAGKLREDEDGILKVEYDDDMDGVEVVVSAAEDIEVAEMIKDDITITAFKEFFPFTGVLNWEGLYRRSLLSVKLTKLKDGFALGCAFNHAIMDGSSVWQFMKAWSEMCNGSTIISIKPFHDRTKARNTRVKLNLPRKPQDQDFDLITPMAPTINHTLFRFSESAIDRIKSRFTRVDPARPEPELKPFSTFECISAHIWAAITRARRLKPKDQTVFTTFADIRKRIDPPMPENYFGNLIQQINTSTTASTLLTGPPETSVSLIQEAIEMLDSTAINKSVTNWETNPELRIFGGLGKNIVSFASSPKFKIYETDFGWGKPQRVWIGPNQMHDGMVYLHQSKNGSKSIDVDICLEAQVMKRLKADKEFLST